MTTKQKSARQLNAETRRAQREGPKGTLPEVWLSVSGEWVKLSVERVKREPFECWANVFTDLHGREWCVSLGSREAAVESLGDGRTGRTVKLREVPDDE